MKKLVVLIMVMVMLFSFTACGKGEQPTDVYPTQTIEFVVPVAAGAEIDLYARALLQEADFGVDTVVINQAGAGQSIGISDMLSREADGHSIGIAGFAGLITQPLTNDALIYSVEDFKTVLIVYDQLQYSLLVRPDYKYKSMEEVLNAMQKGESFAISSPTNMSLDQMIFTYFFSEKGKIDNFDYLSQVKHIASASGTAGAQSDFLGGHTDILATNESTAKTMIEQGLAVPLLALGDKEIERLPGAETAADYGVMGCNDFNFWVMVYVRDDVPDEIVEEIHDVLVDASKSQGYQDFLASMNMELTDYASVEDMTARLVASKDVYVKLLDECFR